MELFELSVEREKAVTAVKRLVGGLEVWKQNIVRLAFAYAKRIQLLLKKKLRTVNITLQTYNMM